MYGKFRVLTVTAFASLAVAGAAFGASKAVFVGTPGPDTIYGTASHDTIFGRGGGDSLRGRDGGDVIYGDAGADLVKGGEGNDVEYGGAGDDTMWVGRGRDAEFGGPGNDVLHALADDNQFDVVDCGSGNDVAWLSIAEKGRYLIRGCEVVNWIVPTAAQAAEETGD
jgi:Ca2+-binding RTX toxin-like protein